MYFVGNHVQERRQRHFYVFEEARQMVLKAIQQESFETYPELNLTTKSQYKDPTITAYQSTNALTFNVTNAVYNCCDR